MPKTKQVISIPAEQLALYDALIATIPGLKRIKNTETPHTVLNGHVFSILSADGTLGLRLPKAVREEFLIRYHNQLEGRGIIQKEYVAVPDELFKNTQELKSIFRTSYDYVQSMKPKPPAPK